MSIVFAIILSWKCHLQESTLDIHGHVLFFSKRQNPRNVLTRVVNTSCLHKLQKKASISGPHATNLQNHTSHEDRHAKWTPMAIVTDSASMHVPVFGPIVSFFSHPSLWRRKRHARNKRWQSNHSCHRMLALENAIECKEISWQKVLSNCLGWNQSQSTQSPAQPSSSAPRQPPTLTT